MKTLLTLTCCVGLALSVSANQQNNNNQQYKKKGGNAPQQQVATAQGNKYKTGPGYKQNYQHSSTVGNQNKYKSTSNKYSNQSTVNNSQKYNANKFKNQSNMNSSASNTAFNKSKNVTINKNVTKNYQVQKFNVSKNWNTKYQAVKFNQNYHISGAQHWHGQKYVVFANYHPVWQSQWWWNQHYHNHIVFVLGGWYYWNAGYWYPAWGYDPGASYYFDGPIYASNPEMDPGQVVANVQSALQEQGYYQGEIDGVLGPQTRAALAEYQTAQQLEPTGAVDEPTLESLGMA